MFGRTISGSYFKLILQRQRDRRGRKLYRLLFLEDGVKGSALWTLEDLVAAGVTFRKRRPPTPRR